MKQALIFGEALYDIFPNKKILGGAPFNVAWNLQHLGASPLFISRVGDDILGEEILSTMRTSHLSVDGVQIDPDKPTGTVSIEMQGDKHQFNINADQAYDYIDLESAREFANRYEPQLLYFGTLSLRNSTSLAALKGLFTLDIPSFVDINLREPWWSLETVVMALNQAHWAKLNDEEVMLIYRRLFKDEVDDETAMKTLAKHFGIHTLIVTCGEKGAYILEKGQKLFRPSPRPSKLVDTVGAGDAFASVCILGILSGWAFERTLERALSFASQVCTLQGATSTDEGFYKQFEKEWY